MLEHCLLIGTLALYLIDARNPELLEGNTMSKPLVLLSALVGAGLLAVTAGMYLGVDSTVVDVRFDQGKTMSTLFVPPSSDKELRIERHPNADGSATDDVWMRDHTTKHIVYDRTMKLRQVFAYFPGAKPEEQGPLMYEKTHDPDGHLFTERHLRLDGSLEMDGALGADSRYVRHLYYPGTTPGASSDPAKLVVSALQVFDKTWKPLSQSDFRPDKTLKLAHVWQKDGSEVVSSFISDGRTRDWEEKTKDGHYDRLDFAADGVTVALETLNDYGGTTFKWFRPDNTMRLSVKYTNMQHMEYTLANASGAPVILQDWEPDYTAKQVNDAYPLMVDHIDHLNAESKVDVRYIYGYTKKLVTVIVLLGGDTYYGARAVYTIDDDGFASKVETYDDKNKSDGGRPLTHADGKKLVPDDWMLAAPKYEQPKLKEGLKLNGEPPQQGPY
jgi:hypothetical protein